MMDKAAIAPASLQIACMIRLLDGRVASITDSQPSRFEDTPASKNLPHARSRVA
jgi:hypothetical protein